MPRARADLGPAHTCPRGLNLVLPRGQGLTSACCEETFWLEIAASFAAFVCRQAHFPHGKWILNSPSGFDASAGRSGSNTVPPEIALNAGLEVNFSLALSQVS